MDVARRVAIEHFLQASAYSSVYFDGINDFHVANEKRAVWEGFSYAREMIIMNGVAVNHIFIKCIVDMTLEQQALAKAGS